MSYLGSLQIYSNGTVRYAAPVNDRPSLGELELIYSAAVGAEAAMGSGESESIVHLAAQLMAKVSARKARERRVEAAAAAEEAAS